MHHPTPSQIAYMNAHIDDDRRSWLIGVNTVCLVLAIVAVALRLASRVKIGTKIGLDDGLVCAALAMLFGHVLCLYITVRYGMGRHALLVSNLKSFYLASLVGQTFYNFCIPTIKFSILCLYSRIFVHTTAWLTPTLWVTALFIFMVTIPQCFVHVFQCVPIDSLWNEYGPGYRVYCINFQAAIVAFGVINIITDWWILALPIPIVMSLSLERRTKWTICSLFLMGGVVCVISIVRLFYAKRFESADPSWDYSTISTISTAECALGILAACMPTWRPLFKFLRSSASSYFGSAGAKSTSNLAYGTTTAVGRGHFFSRKSATPRGGGDLRSKIDHKGMGTGMLRNLGSLKVPNGGKTTTTTMGKRSDTSMSGSSIEKMLSLGTSTLNLKSESPNAGLVMEMEMEPRSASPAWKTSNPVAEDADASDLAARPSPAWTDAQTASPTSPLPMLATTPATLLGSESESRGASRSGSGGQGMGFGTGDPAYEAGAKAGEQRWKEAMEAQRKIEEEREREKKERKERARGNASREGSPERPVGLGVGMEGILVKTTVTRVEVGR